MFNMSRRTNITIQNLARNARECVFGFEEKFSKKALEQKNVF